MAEAEAAVQEEEEKEEEEEEGRFAWLLAKEDEQPKVRRITEPK